MRTLVVFAFVLAGLGCRLERRAPDVVASLGTSGAVAEPAGPLGLAVRRGRAIALATRDSLPDHVGNQLRCTSCHLDGARRPHAAPWVGVTARFPQYRSRAGRVITLEDRINSCLERSMHGRALPAGDDRLRDLVAYMAWLSTGVRIGDSVPGSGFTRLPGMTVDTGRGRVVYAAQCARCHGAGGEGGVAPAVWGPQSFNIGAGMARASIASAFIHANMPYDAPGTLSVQQAWDVAAYVNAQPRPDFARKAEDWPNGDPPPDVAYPVRAAPRSR